MSRLAALLFTLVLAASSVFAADIQRKPNPWLSGAIGAVVPGAGYLYNGDPASAAAGFAVGAPLYGRPFLDTHSKDERSAKSFASTVLRNAYGFTVYDSFQQALDLNGRPDLLVNIPRYSPSDLLLAPLRTSNYRSQKVWMPLAIGAGLAAINVAQKGISRELRAERLLVGVPLILLTTLFVGGGEEAEFRGYYYPAFSELTGNRTVGALMQGLLFGACHTSWTLCSSPMVTGIAAEKIAGVERTSADYQKILESEKLKLTPAQADLFRFFTTAAMGTYFAYVTTSEEDGMLKAAAMHAAWDSIVLVSSLLRNNSAEPLLFSFQFPL